MISADTSSLIAFLQGEAGDDTSKIEHATRKRILIIAPVVATELLSFPKGSEEAQRFLDGMAMFSILPGYWERAGDSRRVLRARGLKARTADALIAQACIDANVPLIARDTDFRHFVDFCGLKLA